MSLGFLVQAAAAAGGRCLGGPGTEGFWAEQAQNGECVHRKVCCELLGGGPEEAADSWPHGVARCLGVTGR